MFKDLLSKMLLKESTSRISIDEILKHPWLEKNRDLSNETKLPENFDIKVLENLQKFHG